MLAVVFALFAAPSVFASIPRSTLLDPPALDLRYELASRPPAPDDNNALLARALDRAMPRPDSLASYAETHVGASDLFAPFERKSESGLTRALRKASPFREFESASDETFCGGDPVNNSDPTGELSWSDVKRHAAVTWQATKGIGRSVGKTVVGVAAGVNLLAGAADPTNIQAKLQLARAVIQTHGAVAQWGTSAGEAIAEPELIAQALNDLSPEEFAEETFDAAIMTSAFVTPLAGVGGEAKAASAFTPRFRINLANTGPKVRVPVNASITIAPAAAVAPKPPGRPTWRTSEISASHDLTGFDFVEQRSYLNGAEVPYGTPGSVRPDFASDAMRITADVKNYNLSTAQGRYNLVQNVIDQATARATHLPAGYRQGLILDVRGQAVNARLLNAMVNRIVRKTGGVVRQENIYFVGID